jgi:hypothetical protein
LWNGTPMSSAMSLGLIPSIAFTTAAMLSTLDAMAFTIW